MKEQKLPQVKDPLVFFLSFAGIGLLPFAPGTWGTLASLPFLYLFQYWQLPPFFLIPPLIILTIGASFACEMCQKKYIAHDPQWIVIDEVIGMAVAWVLAKPETLLGLLLLFFLFRVFDISKVWPANFFDQKIHHGLGIILDDIVSGIYAGFLLLGLQLLMTTYSPSILFSGLRH